MKKRLKLLGDTIRSSRETLGLDLEDLSVITDLSRETFQGIDKGQALPPLGYVQILQTFLVAQGETAKAALLTMLYSKAEAPHLPSPGAWVQSVYIETQGPHQRAYLKFERRQLGKLFDSTGECLLGKCFMCGREFPETPKEPSCCPACGFQYGDMATHHYQDHAEFSDRLEATLKDARESARAARRIGHNELDGHISEDGEEDNVVDPVLIHNRRVGKTVANLTPRERHHYEGAKKLAKKHGCDPFTRAELVQEYVLLSKDKDNTKTVLPSDFSVGATGQAARNPWFLRKEGRGRFRFVGLDGNGDVGQE